MGGLDGRALLPQHPLDLERAAGVGAGQVRRARWRARWPPCARRARRRPRPAPGCRCRRCRSTGRPRRSRRAPGRGWRGAAPGAGPGCPGRARGGTGSGRRPWPGWGGARRPGRHRGQELGDVLHLAREGDGAVAPGRVVLEEVPQVLQVRAAAGGVHQEGVGARGLEPLDQRAGHGPRLLVPAGVDRERAAAALARAGPPPRTPRRRAPAAWPRSPRGRRPAARSRPPAPPARALVPAARAPAGRREVTSPNPRSGASASSRPRKGTSRVRPGGPGEPAQAR